MHKNVALRFRGRFVVMEITGKLTIKEAVFPLEHSENKIITQSRVFENEIEPGVLQSCVLKACIL